MTKNKENKVCCVAFQTANIENGSCFGCQFFRNGSKVQEIKNGSVVACGSGENRKTMDINTIISE